MMGKTALITGASGFVGRVVTRLLLDRGCLVSGLDRSSDNAPDGVQTLVADLAVPGSLQSVPRRYDYVVHLAGISIPSQFTDIAPITQNLQMALNLLDHLEAGVVVLVSSCHVYAPSDRRRTESDPIEPQGRYGLSKHLVEQLASHFRRRLDVRVARPFNHLGPGLRPELAVPSLLRRLAGAPAGDTSPVRMKGRDSTRDFIDVRDVARGYLSILEISEAPAEPVFNVCSGVPRTIGDVVREVLGQLGLRRAVVFEDQSMSADDVPMLVGDPSKLREASGFRVQHDLADSIRTMLSALPGDAER
jgi:GDP-4-dehydro-6-deoxy-D-mannose reductase